MDPAIGLTLRFGLAALLGAAAAHKLRDLGGFRSVLAEYRILPASLVPIAARAIPAAEIAVGASLLVSEAGAVGAALLLVGYSAAIAVNLVRGRRHIDCGCLWGERRAIGWGLVARNAVLVAAALVALRPGDRSLVWVDLLTAGAATAALSACWAAADRMSAAAVSRVRSAS